MRPVAAAGSLLCACSVSAQALKGRFLHITDIHPDYHYVYDSAEHAACHWNSTGKSEKDVDRAGYWGTPVSDCDSPRSLVDATFDFLRKNWRDEVDFVIWTGDNARHDIDSETPRTLPEILALNRDMADRMYRVFGDDVPVVPSLGNNDIYPHNILFPGPSPFFAQLANIWRPFIPEDEFHVFQRGAYYAVEVIPDALAVISLNTIYFYDSNKAVDGCPLRDADGPLSTDPGSIQLEWLDIQLQRFRERAMQVYLTGHVPPLQGNYYELCYERYGELALAYQDIIVGHLFGHMNTDHFAYIDEHEIFRKGDDFSIATIDGDLKDDYEALPKKLPLDDYAIINVSPSIIPTYQPGMRVWTYNTTGETYSPPPSLASVPSEPIDMDTDPSSSVSLSESQDIALEDDESPVLFRIFNHDFRMPSILERKKKKKGNRRKHGHRHGGKRRKRPERHDRHASPFSPSRTNCFLTPLGWTQLYIDLDKANMNGGYGPSYTGNETERSPPTWEIEYTTYTQETLIATIQDESAYNSFTKFLPEALRNSSLSTTELTSLLNKKKHKHLTPYGMADLTIGRWLGLARALVRSKKGWDGYLSRMFISSGAEKD